MNLKLNLEEKSKVFPGLALCSQPTIDTNNIVSIKYEYERNNNIQLRPFQDFFEIIDTREFAYETGMRDVVTFQEYLDETNEYYSETFNRMETDFRFAVNKKYGYKPGTYNIVKDLLNYLQRFYMRPSGMHSIFNRVVDSKWCINNYRDRMFKLDRLRRKAKEASGTIVDNLEDLLDVQTEKAATITESTAAANELSDYFDVTNYIDNHATELGFTSISLYTIVKCHSKQMSIINVDNEEYCKMQVPTCYLYFKRPLYKVLSGAIIPNNHYTGSSAGAYHPYINSSAFYTTEQTQSLGSYGWGSLCLSNFSNDVLNGLNQNDYKAFVMGLMNWNSIYNKDTTNPYNHITKVMSFTGFPKQKTDDENRGVANAIGFRPSECFNEKANAHRITEPDSNQQMINRTITRNIYPYAGYILDACDVQECPFRERLCDSYKNLKSYMLSDWPEMIEEIIVCAYGIEDMLYILNDMSSNLIKMTEDARRRYVSEILTDNAYWINSTESTDETIEETQSRIASWQSRRGENDENRPFT